LKNREVLESGRNLPASQVCLYPVIGNSSSDQIVPTLCITTPNKIFLTLGRYVAFNQIHVAFNSFTIIVVICRAGDGTQGLARGRQAFYS
jgi:hypothetical protein